MNAWQVGLAFATVSGLAIGQVLFKLAAGRVVADGTWVDRLLLNPWLIAALTVYALATGTWIALLTRVPLNLAYPFMALAFVIVPLMSAWLLGEPLHWRTLAGAALILGGVWLSNSGR